MSAQRGFVLRADNGFHAHGIEKQDLTVLWMPPHERVDARAAARPAGRRQIDRDQRCGLGGPRVVGMIGLERFTRDNGLAVPDLVIGYMVHVGVAGDVMLRLVVPLELAEHLRGDLELIQREARVAHHQHVTLGKGAAEGGAGFGVERPGKIETDDFGASVIRQWCDGEGHHNSYSHVGSAAKGYSWEPGGVKWSQLA
jgi:hypothetical protein